MNVDVSRFCRQTELIGLCKDSGLYMLRNVDVSQLAIGPSWLGLWGDSTRHMLHICRHKFSFVVGSDCLDSGEAVAFACCIVMHLSALLVDQTDSGVKCNDI